MITKMVSKACYAKHIRGKRYKTQTSNFLTNKNSDTNTKVQ